MSKTMTNNAGPSQKKAVVHVLGCKVNQAEAWTMGQILRDRGYVVDSSSTEPDLILVNTCCVTARAEAKSRRLIRKLSGMYPQARLIVTGCMAEVNPLGVEGSLGNLNILGTFEKDRFSSFVDRGFSQIQESSRHGSQDCTEFVDLGAPIFSGRARAFLKVQDGCSQRCAYCIVPIARGPSRSLPMDRVEVHVRKLKAAGYAEIVLTGINLGSYGKDLSAGIQLEDLLENVLRDHSDVRFRLSSLEPLDVTPRLIQLVEKNEALCRHFHIPLQSGDDRILDAMGRPYDTSSIKVLTEQILSRIPDACLGFDVMVGFPGEDEAAFRRTVQLIQEAGTAYLHVFPFSLRPGTAAEAIEPKVPNAVTDERVEELRTLSKDLRNRFFARSLGKVFEVVPEAGFDPTTETLLTRTDNYVPVRVKMPEKEWTRKAFWVVVERIVQGEVYGTPLQD
jgi:threonylcarbamoyladenosine tRNA methylthiotransferase MtaB